ncbi:MAG: CoA transferase, partial [Dehalococcoidia bacterium]|nr:CoA transferase [Dehalococcoidia bacterium]
EKRAFDPICQALSSIMWSMGDRDFPEPVQISGAIFDVLGSIMTCYGILAALLHREKTGQGQEIEVSQFGSALNLMSTQINSVSWLGRSIARHSRSRARNPMANHYRCADDKWLMMAEPQSDRFWNDFCQALGIKDLEKDPRFASAKARRENYKELNALLEKKFLAKARDEWIDLFDGQKLGFAYAPVLTSQELLNHPQVLANEYIIEHDHPTMGRTKSFLSPIKFSATPLNIYPAPEFGQHTEEILSEICGYSWEEIGQMRVDEII